MNAPHPTARLEAFSDGVFAIAITLLVIDIKVPHSAEISTAADLWSALFHVIPSVLAFLLSFAVILITWVNHHNSVKLMRTSNSAYLYANGFLLLTVAVTPFPTALLGEYLFTGGAAPAVMLYNAVLSLQALGWVLVTRTVRKHGLAKSEKAAREIGRGGRFGYFAFFLYAACLLLAIWFPLAVAVFTALTWVFWLIYGIRIRHEEM